MDGVVFDVEGVGCCLASCLMLFSICAELGFGFRLEETEKDREREGEAKSIYGHRIHYNPP